MPQTTTAAQFTQRLAENIDPDELGIKVVDGEAEISKKGAAYILEIISAVVIDELDSGQDAVAVKGLGRFKLVDTPAKPRRRGRNPATGEEIWVKAKPAGRKLKFLYEKPFKEALKSS